MVLVSSSSRFLCLLSLVSRKGCRSLRFLVFIIRMWVSIWRLRCYLV